MDNKKVFRKTFEHKGQMINYYNKVKANPLIAFVTCGYEVGYGYTVIYWH